MQSNFSVYDLSIIKDVRELSIILGIVMRFSDVLPFSLHGVREFYTRYFNPLKWKMARSSVKSSKQ